MTGENLPRKAQVLATLGPASNTYEKIEALHFAGADYFRLNFSHGTHEDHARLYGHVHQVRANHDCDIGVMADLCGPKLRIGPVGENNEGMDIGPGLRLTIDLDGKTPGNQHRIGLPHPEILSVLRRDHRLILDDGKVQMRIADIGGANGSSFVEAVVTSGTRLLGKKGLSVPGVRLPISSMTAKDERDMEFALSLGVDSIAISFGQTADDAIKARALIAGRAALIYKVETEAAVRNFAEILEVVDGVIVARGDLGMELGIDEIPNVQRALVRATRLAGKPVIVATEMLETMVRNPRATRPEVNDISQAILQGACGTMLSAESASGDYPADAVATMARQIALTEAYAQDPMAYMTTKFGWAAVGLNDIHVPLPPARLLPTWQQKRELGLPVLPHLQRGVVAAAELVPAG